MSKNGVWAGQEEMIAFMDLFRCRLHVHSPPRARNVANANAGLFYLFEMLNAAASTRRIPASCMVHIIMRNQNHFSAWIPAASVDTKFHQHLTQLTNEVQSRISSRLDNLEEPRVRTPSLSARRPRTPSPPRPRAPSPHRSRAHVTPNRTQGWITWLQSWYRGT